MHQQSARRAPSAATFLRSAQVAALQQVPPKTLTRWAQQGRLPAQRTFDGHRHSPAATIHRLAASLHQEVRDR
jgi:predicted site-specific integrase-resolvase